MTKIQPKDLTDLHDYSTWGVEAHGVRLHINPQVSSLNKSNPWTIDVENNQDGSCAGIGVASDLEDIFFFTEITDKEFFVGAGLIGHNIKYDVQMLRKWGFNVSPDQIIWDTQVAEYVHNSTTNRYGLKDLSKERYAASYPTYEELCGKGKKAVSIGSLPLSVVANYNGCDVFYTSKLCTDQLETFTPAELEYMQRIELPALRAVTEMEERGVEIDANYLRDLDKRFEALLSDVATRIRAIAGAEINLNSHKQIKQLLLDKCSLRLQTTAAEELSKHENVPLVKDLLRYRGLAKLRSTYTSVLIERSEGRLRYRLNARFNQTITHTGRFSSSTPNLQNIPTRTEEGDSVREAFVAKDGCFFADGDYSQIEPRLMAHFSEDDRLMEIFRSGEDLYDGVTKTLKLPVTKENRKISKVLWLAIAYNAGAYKISKTAGISFNKAHDFLNLMRKSFPKLFYWKDKLIAQAEIDGYVTTLFGRRIPLPKEWAHLAPNYKTQGSGAEVVKLALAATRSFSPVLTVHDENMYELKLHDDGTMEGTDLQHIKDAMENVVELSVPLVVELGTGENWRRAKL
jgi:DNA polymerase-1